MENGLNSNVIYQGMTFHVQTEDMGEKNGYLQTQIYYHGKLLSTERCDYTDIIGQEEFSKIMQERIEKEHEKTIKLVKNGQVNIKDINPVRHSSSRSDDTKSGKIKIVAKTGWFNKRKTKPKSLFETSIEEAFVFNKRMEKHAALPHRRRALSLASMLAALLLIILIAFPKVKSGPSKEEQFNQFLREGTELIQKTEFEEAEKVLNQAIALFPNRSQAYIERSLLFAGTGSITQALEDMKQAAALDPANGSILYKLGELHSESMNYEAAVKYFNKAIQSDFRNQKVYAALGTALFKSGDLQEAKKSWRKSLKMDPQNPEVLFNLGLIALKKESYGEAIQNFQAAIETDPGMTEAYTHLGDAYYLSGMRNEAGRSWGKALQLNPENRVAQAKLQSLQ